MGVPSEVRGQTVVPYGSSGFLLPDCYAPRVWDFSAGTQQAIQVLATGSGIGMADGCSDNASGAWVLGYAGDFYHINSNGAVSSGAALPVGNYAAIASSGSSNAFIMSNTGYVYDSAGTQKATFGAVTAPPIDLQLNGATLSTLLPGSLQIGYATIGGSVSTLNLDAAMQFPTCFCSVAANSLLVGGWKPAQLGSQVLTRLAINPANTNLLFGIAASSGFVFTNGSTANAWNLSATVTGVAAHPGACVWTADGTQILVTDHADSSVNVIKYLAGTLSLNQTFTLSGASGIAIMPDSINGIICQPAANQVTPIALSSGTWSTGTALPLTGASDAVSLSESYAAVGYASGVAIYNLTGSTWSLQSETLTGFAVSRINSDAYGNIYAGGAGKFAILNSSYAITGSGAFTGITSDLYAYQSQLAIADSSNNFLRVFGNTSAGSVWAQQYSYAGSGVNSVYMANRSVFIGGSGAAPFVYNWRQPYALARINSGLVSYYNGSSWLDTILGADHTPSSIAAISSGGFFLATKQNDLYTLGASGAVIAQAFVPQYVARPSNIPLGVSNLAIAAGGHLFAACSVSPVVIEVQ